MKRLAAAGLALTVIFAACSDTRSSLGPDGTADVRTPQLDRSRTATHVQKTGVRPMSLSTQDLTTGLTPEDLAQALVGEGVAVSNVSYTGAEVAAGTFSGGTGIIGFEEGVILSSGCISNVIGPNESASVTCGNGTPGDPDLTGLSGNPTFDAAVLEFDFVPTSDRVFIQYVFSSDEYNEFMGTQFNDVFAFFVNGVNYAVVTDPPVPVTINTINEGQPGEEPTNPELYVNNDPVNPNFFGDVVPLGDLLDTEMDGLTVVLTFEAPVHPGELNRMKLAIADAFDVGYDSNVFIQAGTLAVCTPVEAGAVYSDEQDAGEVSLEDEYLYVEILDVEQYLGRPVTPDDVRLGETFGVGTLAEDFEILDLDDDGQRDIRLRVSIEELVDGGDIGPDTEQIQLWGRDQSTGQLYCLTTDIVIVP